MQNSNTTHPDHLPGREYRYDAFEDGTVLHGKKKGHLPAMGWNSWNAFGSGNTEELTKAMADRMVELGLDQLGYQYLVLDDGCYKEERVDGRLSNEETKFPSGFRALADYIHGKGLKFGMYNDIGTNLCAGAYVGTCGHEAEDAGSYVEWDVDFLKVDNCYYLWDNATFSDAKNAKYVFAPALGQVRIVALEDGQETGEEKGYTPGENMSTTGTIIRTEEIDGKLYFTWIGTYDGTGPMHTPVGPESGEVVMDFTVKKAGTYRFYIDHICDCEEGRGSWLQIAANKVSDAGQKITYLYDDLLSQDYLDLPLEEGAYQIRFMNHRRQENTLYSYAKLLEGIKEAKPDHDIIYSMCEWGKTQPQNWAKKVGDSWRILNDITFSVGTDGDPGKAAWTNDYTCSVTSQYNKAVIMDSFAGLDKGWNDPDMMVIGMDGLSTVQYRTHMTMWCMMNSPLMLGLDLRRVEKGDDIYQIIANPDMIALNQDPWGIQAKRVYCSLLSGNYDTEYVTNNDRVDILAKPLSDGSVAVSFINLSDEKKKQGYEISLTQIAQAFEGISDLSELAGKDSYKVKDLWTGEESTLSGETIAVKELEPYDQKTICLYRE